MIHTKSFNAYVIKAYQEQHPKHKTFSSHPRRHSKFMWRRTQQRTKHEKHIVWELFPMYCAFPMYRCCCFWKSYAVWAFYGLFNFKKLDNFLEIILWRNLKITNERREKFRLELTLIRASHGNCYNFGECFKTSFSLYECFRLFLFAYNRTYAAKEKKAEGKAQHE